MSQWQMTNLVDTIQFVPGASDRNLLAEPDTNRSFEVKNIIHGAMLSICIAGLLQLMIRYGAFNYGPMTS